jgi:3-hydroxybutyryl-CoA dehydratase
LNEYSFDEITVGQTEEFYAEITAEKMKMFKEITGDANPLHLDAEYARGQNFPGAVAYGMLTASFLSTLAGMYLPGKFSLIQSVEAKFINPVIPPAVLKMRGEVVEKENKFRLLIIKVEVFNDAGQKVMRGKMKASVFEK